MGGPNAQEPEDVLVGRRTHALGGTSRAKWSTVESGSYRCRGSRCDDLCHPHATLLLEAGVPVKVVSERLGHTNVGFTMKVYQHALSRMQAEAAPGASVGAAEGPQPRDACIELCLDAAEALFNDPTHEGEQLESCSRRGGLDVQPHLCSCSEPEPMADDCFPQRDMAA
jgi:hypothetical protein